jgi:hypothetical protein
MAGQLQNDEQESMRKGVVAVGFRYILQFSYRD